MTPIGTIEMTEIAEAPIVMMIAAGVMVQGEMTAEDTSTGTTTVTALATNATTTMMMTAMVGQLLPETGIEVMWIIGTGTGMKGHGVLIVRQKVRANMEGINSSLSHLLKAT